MQEHGIFDISIYQIQLFLAVAEKSSFSHVAKEMHITQPALSKRIYSLEKMIGVELFDRRKRPLELTPAGTALYNSLLPFITRVEASLNSIRKEYGNDVSRLSVGLNDSGKQLSFLHNAGKALQDEAEGVTFSWEYETFDEWHEMLNNGSIDIMITLRMEESDFENTWEWERIMEVPKLVCMLKTNPLCKKESITYDDLRSQQFVMNPEKIFPAHYRFVREQTMKHAGFEPIVARFARNPHDLIANLKHNDEVVVCDMYLRDVDSDFIKCYELPDTKSGLDAIWRKDNNKPYIKRYLELVREELKKTHPDFVLF